VNHDAPPGGVWLDVDEANVLMLDEGFVLADAGLFAAALLRPQTSIGGDDAYPTVFLKAAAMAESLARNHAFVDGTKPVCTFAPIRDRSWRSLPTSSGAT
jgi:hypothetical protein